MPYVESLEEFSVRQGVGKPQRQGEWFLWKNGAKSDGRRHFDPPEDPVALVISLHRFKQAELDSAKRAYRQAYSNIQTQIEFHQMNAGPMPPDGWEDHLERSDIAIRKLQGELEELESQLPQKPVNRVEERRQQEKLAAKTAFSTLGKFPVY